MTQALTGQRPLVRNDFAYTLHSGSPDVTVICFDHGGPVNVLASDPALDQLQPGDRVVFEDCRSHTDYWPRTYTVHTVSAIQRYADVYRTGS